MENNPIPTEVLWQYHESDTLTKETIEKIVQRIRWRNEYLEFLTDESYKVMSDPVVETLGEARICVLIAQKKAMEIIEKQNQEDIHMDIYIKIRDMLSKLKLEN